MFFEDGTEIQKGVRTIGKRGSVKRSAPKFQALDNRSDYSSYSSSDDYSDYSSDSDSNSTKMRSVPKRSSPKRGAEKMQVTHSGSADY
jgi:hypothetical protein